MIQIVIQLAGYHFIYMYIHVYTFYIHVYTCIIYSGQLWLKFCGMNVTEENKATETEKSKRKAWLRKQKCKKVKKSKKRDCGELSGKNRKSKWQTLCATYAPDCNLSFGLESGWNWNRVEIGAGWKVGSGSGTTGAAGQREGGWLHAGVRPSCRYFHQLSFKKVE